MKYSACFYEYIESEIPVYNRVSDFYRRLEKHQWNTEKLCIVVENNDFMQIKIVSWKGMLVKRLSTSKPVMCS